jgi:predicted molibdopterin-dependent oxidoreductase YjgC
VEKRILKHPVLGTLVDAEECTILVDSKPILARVGEPVLAALLAHGIFTTRLTEKLREPRGLFCGIGLCEDCLVTVNGVRNVRSCITFVEKGMVIETQTGDQCEG